MWVEDGTPKAMALPELHRQKQVAPACWGSQLLHWFTKNQRLQTSGTVRAIARTLMQADEARYKFQQALGPGICGSSELFVSLEVQSLSRAAAFPFWLGGWLSWMQGGCF